MLYSHLRSIRNQYRMRVIARAVTHSGDVNMDKRKLTNSVARFTISSSKFTQGQNPGGGKDV